MFTTKDINVNLSKGKLRLRHVTTKDIDVGIRVEPPKTPIKTKSISTTTMQDVADIAEKKRRDDIVKESKLAKKDKKKIVMAEKEPSRTEGSEGTHAVKESESEENRVVKGSEGNRAMKKEEKKPWNKMNGKERKAYQAEKARKKK